MTGRARWLLVAGGHLADEVRCVAGVPLPCVLRRIRERAQRTGAIHRTVVGRIKFTSHPRAAKPSAAKPWASQRFLDIAQVVRTTSSSSYIVHSYHANIDPTTALKSGTSQPSGWACASRRYGIVIRSLRFLRIIRKPDMELRHFGGCSTSVLKNAPSGFRSLGAYYALGGAPVHANAAGWRFD
jgi:hypothetical protein